MEILTEEQSLLRDAAAGVMADLAPVSDMRALRDAGDTLGYRPALTGQLAEMGFFGVLLPEEAGGTDFGYRAAGLIAEEMGRNLTASPFLSSAVMAATALRSVGGDHMAQWGPQIAAGNAVVALAIDEAAKHNPTKLRTTAQLEGNAYVLNGSKSAVADGLGADRILVSALLGDQPVLLMIDPSAEGVTVTRRAHLDGRNSADLLLENVVAEAMIGDADVLAKTLRAGRAVAASEQMGVALEVADRTVAYLTERKQFGTVIGRFQALQHRAAALFCELEQTASIVAAAQTAMDSDSDDAERLTRAAKAKVAQVARLATEEAVQMHGGVGMTDALDIGLFMKRDRALSEYLGDAGHHIEWLLRDKGI